MFGKKIIIILLVVGFVGVFFAGMFFAKTGAYTIFQQSMLKENMLGIKPESVNFSVFWEAWQLIEANFVGAENLSSVNMIYGAVSGLAESLGDPNTEFLDPKATARFRENIIVGTDLDTAKWEMLERDVAYLKLFRFTRVADTDFEKIALAILGSEAKSIILDLRDNPGGATDVFMSIAARFFKRGEVVTIESFGEGRGEIVHTSQGEGELEAYPVVILINAKTASVAEVFANAMREGKGIQLVGERSMGKGSVQKILSLSGDTALRLTTSELLSPKGNPVSKSGLKPDIEVGTLDGEKDFQLEKAVQIIKNFTR